MSLLVNYFLKVQTEKSLIIFFETFEFFLNNIIWVLTNTFRFSCILHYSCWKISHFLFFFYLFYSEWFCWSFWCGFFWKNDFLVQFCVCIFGEYFFSVGNFRQILILFWWHFFSCISHFFLSFWIYSKILGIFGSLHLSLHIQCFYKDFWRFNAVITGAIFQAFF